MTDAPDVPPVEELLRWLVREAGGAKHLATQAKISRDTVNGWLKGTFPRVRQSAAVDQVDDWARRKFGSRYPPDGFPADGLLYYCRDQPADPANQADTSPDSDAIETDAASSVTPRLTPWWRRRPAQVGTGAILVLVAALVIALTNQRDPTVRSATVVVANKVAFRADKYAEDTTPAYLSSQPVKECKKHGCALPGTDMSSGYSLTVTCHLQGDQMTNYDTTSGAYGVNPNAFYSNEWYRATWQDGRTGYISYVYIAAAYRSGMGCLSADVDPHGNLPQRQYLDLRSLGELTVLRGSLTSTISGETDPGSPTSAGSRRARHSAKLKPAAASVKPAPITHAQVACIEMAK